MTHCRRGMAGTAPADDICLLTSSDIDCANCLQSLEPGGGSECEPMLARTFSVYSTSGRLLWPQLRGDGRGGGLGGLCANRSYPAIEFHLTILAAPLPKLFLQGSGVNSLALGKRGKRKWQGKDRGGENEPCNCQRLKSAISLALQSRTEVDR